MKNKPYIHRIMVEMTVGDLSWQSRFIRAEKNPLNY